MAIQFARVEYVSRSEGKNACCKSAYNARDRINDEQSNVTYTFERRPDNVFHEILLPAHVNEKFKNVSEFANEVERTEKRKNSQLYKEYVIALPDNKDISLKDKIELVNRFVAHKEFVKNGLGVQIDIHKPHDGDKNWHAHILTTTRRFSKDGQELGEKARDLDPSVRGGTNHFVERDKQSIGEVWKDIQNKFFHEKGLNLQVDEISETPGVHLGPVRMRGLMNEAAEFYDKRNLANLEVLKNGEDVLNVVTEKNSVFDKRDLQQVLKCVVNISDRKELLVEAMNSERLLPLKHVSGQDTNLWTTVEVRKQEERAIRMYIFMYILF